MRVECIVHVESVEHSQHTAYSIFELCDVNIKDFHDIADEDVEIPTAAHVFGESRDNFRNRFSFYDLIVEDEVVEVLVVGIVEIAERNLDVLSRIIDVDVVYVIEEIVCRKPVFTAGGIVELRLDRGVGALVGAA